MSGTHALLVADVQNDFCPGGALAVPDGDAVVAVLNRYIEQFSARGLPLFASRDWHPVHSRHFKEFGGTWPPHCIQNTWGARYHPDLRLPPETIVLSKGMDPDQDGYTAFQGIDDQGRTFRELLELRRVRELSVGGLATDYCVKWSVLHALEHGLKVHLLTDAIRGVDLNAGDSQKAIERMVSRGAIPATIDQLFFDNHD